jgi:cytochrome c oxidase subunit 2
MTAWALIMAVPVFAQEGTTPKPSALDPAGPNSVVIADLFNVVLIIATVVFVVVEGLILFSAFRFRRGAKDASEPAQVHGNTKAEIAWTILPAMIVVTLFVLALQGHQTRAGCRADDDQSDRPSVLVGISVPRPGHYHCH